MSLVKVMPKGLGSMSPASFPLSLPPREHQVVCRWRVGPQRGLSRLLQRWKVVLVEISLKSTRRHVVEATGFVGGAIFGEGILGRNLALIVAAGASLGFLIQNIGLSSK